jgi:Dictyostelium (slime mold) repeat
MKRQTETTKGVHKACALQSLHSGRPVHAIKRLFTQEMGVPRTLVLSYHRCMRAIFRPSPSLLALALATAPIVAFAWEPKIVQYDPLVRMPGTQPRPDLSFESAANCLACHGGYAPTVEAGFTWKGTMMAQSGRDPFFWAALTVAAQDSIWALGNPNGTDICLRCHMPKGWLELRSDPTSGAAMGGEDFDGVQCDFCHRMVDPFFQDTHDGTRESNAWASYWDESNASSTPSNAAADMTYQADISQSNQHLLFNGKQFYGADHRPVNSGYNENTSGQYFVSSTKDRRASFADAQGFHPMLYSRYHKSKYYCSTCHDVSNPALANQNFVATMPEDGMTVLPTESQPPSEYFHVERTFSEFMLSDYGLPGGAPGVGPYAPDKLETAQPGNAIASCQDCHMPDGVGPGASLVDAVVRPQGSTEHPNSGQPIHDLTGGNAFVPWLLASTVSTSPNYDETNAMLLGQGSAKLTLVLDEGLKLDPAALLAASNRAVWTLKRAASILDLTYDAATGATSFKLRNNTGHKLITGYPEGRRMFLNLRLSKGTQTMYEINPYDANAGTFRGLDPVDSPASPPLGANEAHFDPLVYEVKMASSLTGQSKSFHFLLGTERFKDNRIPPKGFRIGEAKKRIAEPVWLGTPDPNFFSAAEYTGGYDQINLMLPTGATRVDVRLYYQTTSREYVEFLRDEINGTATSLGSPAPSGEPKAYIAQTDPFFSQLAAWGDTIWQLWMHNKDIPGAAPIEMTNATVLLNDICKDAGVSDGTACDDGNECTSGETCSGGACSGGMAISCDDGNGCTDDTCDTTLGCTHAANAAPCDDGNVCTQNDGCAYGACTGKTKPCLDGDPCTKDTCDPQSGCVYEPIANCGTGGMGGGASSSSSNSSSSSSVSSSSGAGGGMGGQGPTSGAGGSTPIDDENCGCRLVATNDEKSGHAAWALAVLAIAARKRRNRC